jgi:mannitol/fructose-specific phosphotransferase system IIA component (Ntr-type)
MIKAVDDYGPYMVMIPEIALFHGGPNEGVKEICLSLATFSEPIQFNEERSIKAAFTFAAVDSNSHVDMLSKIAVLLQNEDFVTLLRNNGSKEEIMNIIKNY